MFCQLSVITHYLPASPSRPNNLRLRYRPVFLPAWQADIWDKYGRPQWTRLFHSVRPSSPDNCKIYLRRCIPAILIGQRQVVYFDSFLFAQIITGIVGHGQHMVGPRTHPTIPTSPYPVIAEPRGIIAAPVGRQEVE